MALDPELSTARAAPRAQRAIVGEFGRLVRAAHAGWSSGRRPWLAVLLSLASIAVALLIHAHVARPELWRSGDVYAALPLSTELARLPISLFMPTAYLPLWGAVAQLAVVIGLGEIILGRSATVLVAAAGHFGSTLLARVLLDTPHVHILGLTPALAHVLDTGPSGATTAVGACLLVSLRMNRAAFLLFLGLAIAGVVAPGLDALEHGVALFAGLSAGVMLRWMYLRPARRAWAGPYSSRALRWLHQRRPGIVALRERR